MILGDSSVWIAAMRHADDPWVGRFRAAADAGELVTTDPIVMEVLAGAPTDQVRATERALALHPRLPTEQQDFDDAAAIYRECRRRGATPRSLTNCLIAAVARRVDAAVLHRDRDFDLIAEHVELRIVR